MVNEVEEAPYQYAVGENRAHTRAFMNRVRAEIKKWSVVVRETGMRAD